MKLTPTPPRHPLGPLPTARAAAVLAAVGWGLFIAHRPAVWVGASLAGYAELVWWTARTHAAHAAERARAGEIVRRPDHRIAMVTGLCLWLIDPLRVLCGAAWGVWWLIGFPVLIVNRQRVAHWRRARRGGPATTVKDVVAGAVRHLGLTHPTPPPPPVQPTPGMVFVTGVMHQHPDGSRTFEPLEQAS